MVSVLPSRDQCGASWGLGRAKTAALLPSLGIYAVRVLPRLVPLVGGLYQDFEFGIGLGEWRLIAIVDQIVWLGAFAFRAVIDVRRPVDGVDANWGAGDRVCLYFGGIQSLVEVWTGLWVVWFLFGCADDVCDLWVSLQCVTGGLVFVAGGLVVRVGV